MPTWTWLSALQCVVALGLLNVWIMRARMATPYRGGSAQSLKQEFVAYGLPAWFCYLVGGFKIGSAGMLIAGLWMPLLVPPAAGVVVGLMVGALGMHAKVNDPAIKSLPAALMLAMSVAILALALAHG